MRHQTVQHAFFFALLILTTYVFLDLIQEFLQPVFWAAVLAIIFRPVHLRWSGLLPGKPSVAALLTVLTVLIAVIVPLFFVSLAVSREALYLYEQISSGAIDLQAPIAYMERTVPLADPYLDQFGIDFQRISQNLSSFAVTASRYVASRAVAFGQSALSITILFFLMLYLLFFFVRDGGRILEGIIRALPLGDKRERMLLAKFAEVSRATIKGTLVVGAVQGALGGLAFWILGIGAPFFWGVMMTIVSVFPAVGAAIVWLPAALVLIFTGQVVKGIILIVFGVLVIGLVDNLLRPILVGRDTRMPDYLILVSTLGGLSMFGISGFVIGPVIAALFLVVWDIFRQEYTRPQNAEAVIQAAVDPHGKSVQPPQPEQPPGEAPSEKIPPSDDTPEPE